jgi:Ca2+/Na+ antiporter
MSTYMTILTYIVVGILLISLIYTWRVAKSQKAVKETHDSQISEKVQNHPYLRNPIFIAYFVFVILLLLIIAYAAFSTR